MIRNQLTTFLWLLLFSSLSFWYLQAPILEVIEGSLRSDKNLIQDFMIFVMQNAVIDLSQQLQCVKIILT